jgi:hypothetical protein
MNITSRSQRESRLHNPTGNDSQPRRKGTLQLLAPFVDNRPQASVQRHIQELADNSKHLIQARRSTDQMNNASPIQLRASLSQSNWKSSVLAYRQLNRNAIASGEKFDYENIKPIALRGKGVLIKPYPGFGANVGKIVAGQNKDALHSSNYNSGDHTEPGLITRSLGADGDTWGDANEAVRWRNISAEGNAMISDDINMNGDEERAPSYDGFTIYTERKPCSNCDSNENLGNDRYKENIDNVQWTIPNDGQAPSNIAEVYKQWLNTGENWNVVTYGPHNTKGLFAQE